MNGVNIVETNLQIKTSRVFRANWNAPNDIQILVNRGGTRSTKTYSLAQLFVNWLLTGQAGKDYYPQLEKSSPEGKIIASIVRKSLPILKATVLRDILEIMHNGGFYDQIKHRKVDNYFEKDDRILEYFSLDDQQKVRGRGRALLWCNEANEFNFKNEFVPMLIRTSGRTYLDFNPDDPDIWINHQIEQKRRRELGDVAVIVSNYTHNKFLSKNERTNIEYLRQTDPTFWTIFGLGQYGYIKGLVYPRPWIEILALPEEYPSYFGLDFGFYPDPAVLVEIKEHNNNLYIKEILYERGLTTGDLGSEIRALEIRDPIYCDASEPKAIKELRRDYRLRALPAPKGPDSLRQGISIVKSFKQIYVTRDSTNIFAEKRRYKYPELMKPSPEGRTESRKPLDSFNHTMDAIRYGVIGYKDRGRRRIKIKTL